MEAECNGRELPNLEIFRLSWDQNRFDCYWIAQIKHGLYNIIWKFVYSPNLLSSWSNRSWIPLKHLFLYEFLIKIHLLSSKSFITFEILKQTVKLNLIRTILKLHRSISHRISREDVWKLKMNRFWSKMTRQNVVISDHKMFHGKKYRINVVCQIMTKYQDRFIIEKSCWNHSYNFDLSWRPSIFIDKSLRKFFVRSMCVHSMWSSYKFINLKDIQFFDLLETNSTAERYAFSLVRRLMASDI